jgi:hypothetical protein
MILIISCGYRSLLNPVEISLNDRVFLDLAQCGQMDPLDTNFIICSTVISESVERLKAHKTKLKGIFIFSSGCHGFQETFKSRKAALDSISELSYEIIFNDDFTIIPRIKANLNNKDWRGQFWIADENYYGKFVDIRAKNKKMMEELGFSQSDIRINPNGKKPEDELKKFDSDYAYLTGTLYCFLDKSGKAVSLSYSANADEVRKLLKNAN